MRLTETFVVTSLEFNFSVFKISFLSFLQVFSSNFLSALPSQNLLTVRFYLAIKVSAKKSPKEALHQDFEARSLSVSWQWGPKKH